MRAATAVKHGNWTFGMRIARLWHGALWVQTLLHWDKWLTKLIYNIASKCPICVSVQYCCSSFQPWGIESSTVAFKLQKGIVKDDRSKKKKVQKHTGTKSSIWKVSHFLICETKRDRQSISRPPQVQNILPPKCLGTGRAKTSSFGRRACNLTDPDLWTDASSAFVTGSCSGRGRFKEPANLL